MVKLKKKLPGNTTSSVSVALATSPSAALENIEDYGLWIYGVPKIGKTTFSACFSNCHHFMFEQGAKALSVYQRPVTTWPEWIAYQKAWAGSDFVTATVDVVEIAYEMCFAYMCKQMGIDHPHDQNDMGKSWGRIRQEFMARMTFMQQQAGKGCVFISHASSSTRKTADGDEIDDIHPALTGRPMESLAGAMDIIGYMHVKAGRRVIQIRGDENVMAGCRIEGRFIYKEGMPVIYIPMGLSKEETYSNFMRAFNNEMSVDEVAFITEKKYRPKVALKAKK